VGHKAYGAGRRVFRDTFFALCLVPLGLIHILLPLSEKKVMNLSLFLIRGVVENLTPSDTQLDDIWAGI
jgi:hypothetical protein